MADDDLITFLRARLNEDKAAARPFRSETGFATGWRCDEVGGAVREVGTPPFGLSDVIARSDIHATAVHIARHDPARVLAGVDAQLRYLDAYELTVRLRDEAKARIVAARPGLAPAKDFDRWARADVEAGIMRPALAVFAAPFADHADYRAEWVDE